MPSQRRYSVAAPEPILLPGQNTGYGGIALPVVDANAADAQADAADQKQKWDALKSAPDMAKVALGSPDAAGEVQGYYQDRGLPAVGAAIGGVRRASTLPPAPDMPGGSTLPPLSVEQLLASNTAEQLRAEMPFDQTMEINRTLLSSYYDPQFSQLKSFGSEQGRLKAQLDPNYGEAAVINAKRTEDRKQYGLDTPGYVDRTRQESEARNDEDTAGHDDRAGIDTDEQKIREKNKADIDYDLYGDKAGIDVAKTEVTTGLRQDAQTKGYQARKGVDLTTAGPIAGAKATAKALAEGAAKRRLGQTKDPKVADAEWAEKAADADTNQWLRTFPFSKPPSQEDLAAYKDSRVTQHRLERSRMRQTQTPDQQPDPTAGDPPPAAPAPAPQQQPAADPKLARLRSIASAPPGAYSVQVVNAARQALAAAGVR